MAASRSATVVNLNHPFNRNQILFTSDQQMQQLSALYLECLLNKSCPVVVCLFLLLRSLITILYKHMHMHKRNFQTNSSLGDHHNI